MALTDIARQLKKTFDGFETSGFGEQLKLFIETYKDAEIVRIGETDYIVINDEYKNDEHEVPNGTSPLFCNITKTGYAIIDARTSSTLIDEVYSRVTYMRRSCRSDIAPNESDIEKSVHGLIGNDLILNRIVIPDDDGIVGKANIFQCQLIKDTGVSASPDVYSFMIKNGDIKEIDENVMKQIKRSGEVSLLKDRNVVEENNAAIQKAVFEKFKESDIEIQNITVKSIFEIAMAFRNVQLRIESPTSGKRGIYYTTHLPGERDEFDALNASIHVCNSCNSDLVSIDDGKRHKMHINTDALTPDATEDNPIYAVGCEECLEECPECHEWHFNYGKFIGNGKRVYDKIKFAHGREFIKGLQSVDGNYCSCRENIEWIYDERTGDDGKYDIIPIQKMAFVNYANERIASYKDWTDYYNNVKKRLKGATGRKEAEFAKQSLAKFKKRLAEKFDIDVKDVRITSVDRCHKCSVCGGYYVPEKFTTGYDYRCPVCDELVTEKLHMLTRVDGVIFMRKQVKNRDVISKYIMTKFGNLKKLSQNTVVSESESEASGFEDDNPSAIGSAGEL